MKNKIIIGAGILLTVFIFFLIAISGASGGDKIVTEEKLKATITNITCQIDDEETINYELNYLTNNIEFDEQIKARNYKKIVVNKQEDIQFLGVAFLVKSTDDTSLNISLTKNGEVVKTSSVNLESDTRASVELLLENTVQYSAGDELAIVISQSKDVSFVFDTMIFLFDEV